MIYWRETRSSDWDFHWRVERKEERVVEGRTMIVTSHGKTWCFSYCCFLILLLQNKLIQSIVKWNFMIKEKIYEILLFGKLSCEKVTL